MCTVHGLLTSLQITCPRQQHTQLKPAQHSRMARQVLGIEPRCDTGESIQQQPLRLQVVTRPIGSTAWHMCETSGSPGCAMRSNLPNRSMTAKLAWSTQVQNSAIVCMCTRRG